VLVFASRPDSSFLLAVDPQQGKTDWKAERPAPAAFWNTPVVIQSWQREVVVLAADGQLEGYSAHDGQTLWRRSGLPPAAFEPAPAELPRTGEGVVLVPFSTPGGMGCYKPLPAGREPAEVWRTTTPSACPLLAFEGVAYALDPAGRLAAVDLQSGAALWSQPLPGDHPLPPVAAGDRVYFFRRDGACTVLASGRKFAPLAFNTIGSAGGVHAAVPFDGGFLFRAADRLTRVSAAAASKPRYEWGAKP
jgi:outer membrane protein assembly factor BamB